MATVNVSLPGSLTGRVKADISIGSILGHALLWILLSVVTLGIALFFYPYAFAKLVINRCSIVDGQGREARLVCEMNILSQLWHIIVWGLLSLITLGIAYFFYLFKVFNYALNNTRIVP
jgi:uncharacterized membrane protein YjgN (DUF898 family)